MLYELRIYELLPGKAAAVHAGFASVVTKLFDKHGIRAVGYWEDVIGTSNRLIYMLAWQDLAEREAKMGAFYADPGFVQYAAENQADPRVARVVNTIMRPTSYSSMQ